MKNKKSSKIFIWTMSVFLFLTLVLAIHIYIETRPRPIDPNAIVMARIDIKNSINLDDANKITSWLYRQTGVDHVLVNPKTRIVIFTFFPVKTTGDLIVKNFQASFDYQASRFIPTQEQVQSGCPVLSYPATNKVYTYIKHIF